MLEVLPFVEDPDLSGSAAPALPQLLTPCLIPHSCSPSPHRAFYHFPKLYSLSPMASYHQVVVNGFSMVFVLQVTIVVHDFAMFNAYHINIFINILILQVELYAGSSQPTLTSPLNEQLNFVIFITISIA